MSLPGEVTAELFRAIAEYTYDWETWVDAGGATRWINGAVERITGYSVEACLALPDYPLVLAWDADRSILAGVLSDARTGGSGNDVEFRVRTRVGALRWVAISWQSVRSSQGASLGYRTSIRDIDERKQMEAELERIRQKAEALAQARSELLANVSHELRSPAHCIAGFADLLREGTLTDKQRHYVEVISAQCRSMQRQVEDLLSLTALEAGGVELVRESVNLVTLVEALIEVSQPVAQASGVKLSAEVRIDEPVIEADGLRLQQVLRNLLDNALKFTERGSVSLVVSARDDAAEPRLVFELIDTGSGMDQSEVEGLLLPFRQGDASSTKRQAGVGLGLSIVQRLVSAMAGQLTIVSQRGVGTHVTVSLPWLRATQSAHEAPVAHAQLSSGHALVVDDSPHARELLAGLLEACGFTSVEAASASRARELVAQQSFDVIFLDYQMPESDGGETAMLLRRALASEAGGSHVPIFIVTANVFADEQLRHARAYVDGVVPKPLSRAALRVLLGQLPQIRASKRGPADQEVLREEVVHDLEAAQHRSGKSLLAHLVPQVAQDVAGTYARAEAALEARDAEALRRFAHALSGHVSLLGAVRAHALATRLELLAEQAPLAVPEAERLLRAFWQAWLSAHSLLLTRSLV